MPYQPFRRGTVLIPSGPSHDVERKHLFVICTDCCVNGCHLLLPITSWLNDLCDATCRIHPGEHRFIIKPSYVLYRKARIQPATVLVDGVNAKLFTPHDPMNAQTFLRIAHGICQSPHTPRKIKIYHGCPEAGQAVFPGVVR